jgi:parallel beta-helix repeat protein
MKKIFYMAVFFILISTSSLASNYYVDYVGGSNSANGTSTSTPWKHCPGDVNATLNPLSTTLSGGDTVFFKGGVQYNGYIIMSWSGTSGSLITYDGNSNNTWGTGRAIIDGGNSRSAGFITSTSRSYLTIKNFEIRNIIDDGWAAGILINSTGTGITIENCYIWDIGYWEATGSPGAVTGTGIWIASAVSSLISGNEITECGDAGIRLQGGSHDSIISNNTIHSYVRWALDIDGHGSAAPYNITISLNTIYDLYLQDCDYWAGCACGAGDCAPHTDFIFFRGDNSEGNCPKDITVEKNLMYNNASFGSSMGGTAFIYNGCLGNPTKSDNIIIRNNVFINPHSYAGLSLTGTNYSVHNNIFYTTRPDCTAIGNDTTPSVKNNIVVSGTLISGPPSYVSGWDIDYNYYYSAISEPFKVDGVATYNFSDWKSIRSKDAHSFFAPNVSAIKFVDISGFPTACNTMNLSLQADSPAINVGTDLSAYFTTDKSGNTRTGTWDIGAYEYGSGGSAAGLTIPGGVRLND